MTRGDAPGHGQNKRFPRLKAAYMVIAGVTCCIFDALLFVIIDSADYMRQFRVISFIRSCTPPPLEAYLLFVLPARRASRCAPVSMLHFAFPSAAGTAQVKALRVGGFYHYYGDDGERYDGDVLSAEHGCFSGAENASLAVVMTFSLT